MKHILLAAFCISLALCSDVITATDKTFQKEVIDSPVPVLVKFYAPWCGHCKALAPAWEQVATNLKGVLPIVKVDCTTDQQLCGRYQVQGYPTIKLFKNKKATDYNGGRDAKSLVSFATSNIKSSVERIKDEAGLEKFLNKNPALPHVLLFSEKDPSTLYNALSMRYEGKIVFGQVKKGVDAVVSKYNVESFPHLITITGEQVDHFAGDLGKDNLRKYADQLAAGVKAGDIKGEPVEEKKEAKPKKEKKEAKPLQEIKADNVSTVCKGTLCVIAFVDATEGAVEASQKAVIDALYAKYSKDGKFTFGWTSCEGDSKALCDKLDVTSKPTLAVLNSKKGKVAKAAGFTAEDAASVLNRALSGDLSYSKLKQDL